MRNAVIASADVLFWLHHAEIDRIWSVWQRTHNGTSTLGLPDRLLDPYTQVVDDVLDPQALGFRYI